MSSKAELKTLQAKTCLNRLENILNDLEAKTAKVAKLINSNETVKTGILISQIHLDLMKAKRIVKALTESF
jgi:hypothetical protein